MRFFNLGDSLKVVDGFKFYIFPYNRLQISTVEGSVLLSEPSPLLDEDFSLLIPINSLESETYSSEEEVAGIISFWKSEFLASSKVLEPVNIFGIDNVLHNKNGNLYFGDSAIGAPLANEIGTILVSNGELFEEFSSLKVAQSEGLEYNIGTFVKNRLNFNEIDPFVPSNYVGYTVGNLVSINFDENIFGTIFNGFNYSNNAVLGSNFDFETFELTFLSIGNNPFDNKKGVFYLHEGAEYIADIRLGGGAFNYGEDLFENSGFSIECYDRGIRGVNITGTNQLNNPNVTLRASGLENNEIFSNAVVVGMKQTTFFTSIVVGGLQENVVPVAGMIRYDESTNKHQGYDGVQWNDLY
jgi:hypothetical protein